MGGTPYISLHRTKSSFLENMDVSDIIQEYRTRTEGRWHGKCYKSLEMQNIDTDNTKNTEERFLSSGFGISLRGKQDIKIYSHKTQPTAPPTENDKPTKDATV